ncbi:hypothetical protein H9I84_004688 [Escherichia coli]|nr:hypothetical protein [Escherichia coli]
MKRLKSVSDAVIQLRLNAVKASIQSVNPNEFITHCLDYNLQKFNNQLEMLQHLPWVVNLCIKWSASALGKKRKFKHIDRPGAVRLLQRAYEELSIIPTGLENIDKGINFFLRNTLYQQGIYQRLDALNTISRQVFLFSSLDDNNRIKRRFKELTDVDINDFLKLSFVLVSLVTLQAPVKKITIDSFAALYSVIPKDTIEKFLNTISIPYEELARFCCTKDNETPLVEYYAPSPFLEKPFIKFEGNYHQIHTQLTSTSIQTFIYDLLRRDDAESFMDKFGRVFENAVNQLLDESGIAYIAEGNLKEYLPQENKVVDFLLPHDEANIFIDAKGVEINQKGMVTLRPGDISANIKSSVLKTIEQAHSVNRELIKKGNQNFSFKKESYILCLTYKNLFLGNGTFLNKSYANIEMKKIRDRHSEEYQIPDENIFCISFEEFEYLLSSCKEYSKPVHVVLREAVVRNQTPSSAVFLFAHHIRDSFPKIRSSEIVRLAGLSEINHIVERLEQAGS